MNSYLNWENVSPPISTTCGSAQNESAWIVGTDGHIYNYDNNNYIWNQVTDVPTMSPFVSLSVSFDGTVVALTNDHVAYQYAYGYWSQIMSGIADVASGDVDNFILVDILGNKFKSSHGMISSFATVSGPSKISTTAGLEHVWGVNVNGAVYKFNQSTSSWTTIGGRSLKQIDVSLSSSHQLQVVGVDASGSAWRYNNSWSQITPAPNGEKFVWIQAGPDYVWASTSVGQVYRATLN
jgi:hypothetical protein